MILLPYEGAADAKASMEMIRSIPSGKSIGIFIGPEGGFEKSEVEEAEEAGAKILTLGRRILRTETAAVAVMSILMFELEAR